MKKNKALFAILIAGLILGAASCTKDEYMTTVISNTPSANGGRDIALDTNRRLSDAEFIFHAKEEEDDYTARAMYNVQPGDKVQLGLFGWVREFAKKEPDRLSRNRAKALFLRPNSKNPQVIGDNGEVYVDNADDLYDKYVRRDIELTVTDGNRINTPWIPFPLRYMDEADAKAVMLDADGDMESVEAILFYSVSGDAKRRIDSSELSKLKAGDKVRILHTDAEPGKLDGHGNAQVELFHPWNVDMDAIRTITMEHTANVR